MNSRRSILKLIGLAPAAAGSAASQLAPFLSSPAVVAATALAGSGGNTVGMPEVRRSVLGPLLEGQLRKLKRAMENETYIRQRVRANGLDADIAALRSTSRAHKERLQIERDIADDALLRHADHVMWGE